MTAEERTKLRLQKEQEYISYIKEHIENIQKAKLIVKDKWMIGTELEELIPEFEVACMSHDASKYSQDEFDAYRRHFHPINDEEKKNSKKDFDKAWEHHYMNNKHHWNYWVDRSVGVADRMPMVYILEMMADWIAMSLKFHSSLYEWYYKKKEEIIFHPDTKAIVDRMVEELKDMKF